MHTYTTGYLTGKQTDEFVSIFDREIGTETEVTQDGELFTVTCFELTATETSKCHRIEWSCINAGN